MAGNAAFDGCGVSGIHLLRRQQMKGVSGAVSQTGCHGHIACSFVPDKWAIA
jgi:hypothetical protein